MTPEQVHEQAKLSVRFARQFTDDVEFSPEDGYRSEPDFLCRVLESAIAEGATTINIPTRSVTPCPSYMGQFLRMLRERVPNSDKAVWSVHCHNDLGMAVANSLAGVMIGGARQVECTINGLGERAGNCSLEEVVMAVRTRRDFFNLEVGIDTTQIVPASKLVAGITGFAVQPNKAVVGANAFAHASGIHQDGVLKARDTYEIMRAEDVGWSANKIVLGKLSGRNAFKQRVNELAIPLESEAELERSFCRVQGARRPQVRDLRRGHSGAVLGRSGDAARRALQVDLDDAEVRNRERGRMPGSYSRSALRRSRRSPMATARSMLR